MPVYSCMVMWLSRPRTFQEQMVLSILRIETPGGLLEASKEDIADAFRLIVTADVDFGNIAYGVLDTLYVPMTLASGFGLRHSPSAFEVLSSLRAVLDTYHRTVTRECDEGSRFDACERFVDDRTAPPQRPPAAAAAGRLACCATNCEGLSEMFVALRV